MVIFQQLCKRLPEANLYLYLYTSTSTSIPLPLPLYLYTSIPLLDSHVHG